MKVLDLKCAQGHVFEGWFASQADFDDQQQRHLVECPMCGNAQVEKQLSAPRLAIHRAVEPAGPAQSQSGDISLLPSAAGATPAAGSRQELVAARAARMLQMARELIKNSEDVGDRFVDEARRMHHGEAEHRNIRGTASLQDAIALTEEGVPVLALDIPDAAKGPLH